MTARSQMLCTINKENAFFSRLICFRSQKLPRHKCRRKKVKSKIYIMFRVRINGCLSVGKAFEKPRANQKHSDRLLSHKTHRPSRHGHSAQSCRYSHSLSGVGLLTLFACSVCEPLSRFKLQDRTKDDDETRKEAAAEYIGHGQFSRQLD